MPTARALLADDRWIPLLRRATTSTGGLPAPISATVVSSFDHAINIEVDEEPTALWTILSRQRTLSPQAIICTAESFQREEAGSPVVITQDAISFQSFKISTFRCAFVTCAITPLSQWLPAHGYSAAIPGLVQWWRTKAPIGSFALRDNPSDYERHLHCRLVTGVDSLSDSLLGLPKVNHSRVAAAAENLVGLGIGLTPSGDDMLTGLLATVQLVPALAPLLEPLEAGIEPQLSGTTDVSRQFLTAALEGRFHRDVADAARAIATSPYPTEPALSRLLGLGSTSGSDTLIGILCGFSSLMSRPLSLSSLKRTETHEP